MAMSVRHAAQNWRMTPAALMPSTMGKRSDQSDHEREGDEGTDHPERSGETVDAHMYAVALGPAATDAMAANQNQPLNWKCRNHWMLQ